MREEKKTMTTCAQVATPTLLATGRYTFTQNLVRDCLACGRSYATQFVEGLDSLWVTDLNREQLSGQDENLPFSSGLRQGGNRGEAA